MSTIRKVKLSREEASSVYSVLNQPADPRAGLSVKEVRKVSPMMDRLEEHGTTEEDPRGNELLKFEEAFDFEMKESEYNLIKERMENSSGWVNATHVRRVVSPLIEKLEEAEKVEVEDPSDTKKKKGKDSKGGD